MIDQVRPSQLTPWFASVAEHGAPLVLDVREPHERELARIEGSLSIPLNQLGKIAQANMETTGGTTTAQRGRPKTRAAGPSRACPSRVSSPSGTTSRRRWTKR